ncbi:glycoside hydrolase family 99-like domain-containing protein [Shewanella sp. GD04112]|uniref:glycosyltransferase WbsX family protein n=1 Tax=Shewanella sp. GD04112 TaxID=2975434 RepID=UPI00244BC4D4|nr:glycoside hydrolase family 99-like domain-containing protein [Shewanella sp. GD04112]MDH0447938.1 glycoside hydrolase family 99-like domain-containing protein [Shewanella sp. GD04112]
MSCYKIFPLYFPQLYSIPENDKWWGDGFTDWELVKSAKPLFQDHFQPRRPLYGHLDQSLPQTIEKQCSIAKSFGISGFNFYHYWFDGKVLLDAPVTNLLNNPDIQFEFFFTWANENWTRQWIGKPGEILVKNSYERSDVLWNNHFEYLLRFFNDSRYTKIDGKPIFCIYRPEIIPNLDDMLDYFNTRAIQEGFSGIHFIAMRAYILSGSQKIYNKFESVINFQPRFAINKYLASRSKLTKYLESFARKLPESMQSILTRFVSNKSYRIYSYSDYINSLKNKDDYNCYGKECYQIVFPDWDNTARYGDKATLFSNVSIPQFKCAIDTVVDGQKNFKNKILFINAWNEWSEGAYIEPDEINTYKKLEIIKSFASSDC